jgi:hypothetical protein
VRCTKAQESTVRCAGVITMCTLLGEGDVPKNIYSIYLITSSHIPSASSLLPFPSDGPEILTLGPVAPELCTCTRHHHSYSSQSTKQHRSQSISSSSHNSYPSSWPSSFTTLNPKPHNLPLPLLKPNILRHPQTPISPNPCHPTKQPQLVPQMSAG